MVTAPGLEGFTPKCDFSRRTFVIGVSSLTLASPRSGWAAGVEQIEPQPYFASVRRAIGALMSAGQPMAKADVDALAKLAVEGNPGAVTAAEAILDRYILARVTLDTEGMGTATLGSAKRELVEQGWKSFLVRVSNPTGLTGKLDASAGLSVGKMSRQNGEQKASIQASTQSLFAAPFIEKLWLTVRMQATQALSGATIEYMVIDLFSRDRGFRIGNLGFGVGYIELSGSPYTRSLWQAYKSPLMFSATALPTAEVKLAIVDSDGIGCMASLLIKDRRGHIYPPQVMRLAPDMAFHPHIYRADGESVRLPDDEYEIVSWRGPEYLRQRKFVRISNENRRITVRLQRWIDPAHWGWYSGDTHIHAAGCSHYMHPSEGVTPETMIRHVRGEALNIGDVLTWGPAWYHQKQFFTGHTLSPDAGLEYPELQAANSVGLEPKPTSKDGESLLRYDVEVSQFPSSHSGHSMLLRMAEQEYPGTKTIEDWPSWNLPILQWGKKQGALVGYAHCGDAMAVSTTNLPNYEIPSFAGVGANEALVDVTHDACEFLSGCEWEPASELNIWYHILNCGFRLAMVGETDYPCIYDERPGVGRSYVQLDRRPIDDAGYNVWIEGIRKGQLYCGDGRSHFLKVAVDERGLGETLALAAPGTINITATVAARLEPMPPDEKDILGAWHIERARIGETRRVPIELVVNGSAVEQIAFTADGKPREVRFQTRIEHSSWVALRILPSGHTHPIFVIVAGKPVRASRRSAEWLRKCVDTLWQEKHRLIRDSERPAAAEAYDHARRTYDRIIAESVVA